MLLMSFINGHDTMLISVLVYYHWQTKFAKVMFSQVSVCPWVGGVCMVRGMRDRGCAWWGWAWQER